MATLRVVLTMGGFEEPKLRTEPFLWGAECTLSRVVTFYPETSNCKGWGDMFVSAWLLTIKE